MYQTRLVSFRYQLDESIDLFALFFLSRIDRLEVATNITCSAD